MFAPVTWKSVTFSQNYFSKRTPSYLTVHDGGWQAPSLCTCGDGPRSRVPGFRPPQAPNIFHGRRHRVRLNPSWMLSSSRGLCFKCSRSNTDAPTCKPQTQTLGNDSCERQLEKSCDGLSVWLELHSDKKSDRCKPETISLQCI